MKIFKKEAPNLTSRIHYEAPFAEKISGSPANYASYVNTRNF